jgi:hypothetical protein
MTNKCMVALSLLSVLVWADGAQDPKAVISNASKALGSDNLKTIEYSGSGYDFAIGQAPNPSSSWPKFNDKTYTRLAFGRSVFDELQNQLTATSLA